MIATIAECSQKTLESRGGNKAILKGGRANFKKSIRRKQFKKAMAGSTAMLIWLEKQVLGQKEIVRQEHMGKDEGPLEMQQLRDLPKEEL